ncbi:site-specific integrase [Geomonas subterranea]|uniref:site-specific integrase n=1 Tax=Geomonas subterranea TaxID=2847989 RepID=UPI00296F9582|nr:site-specific integrase [Geomonas fuzhouensis]
MRPFKQGLFSYVSHIYQRKGIYYYRVNVPVDLQQHFPTEEIKKSLKTREPKAAKVMAVSLEYRIQQAFTIIRSGMLGDDMIRQVVESIVPSRQKASVTKGTLLTTAIGQYTEVKQLEWTPKTVMEMGGVFRLLVDILGDVAVKDVTKQTMLDLRSKLMRLPANRYKKYPEQTIQQLLEMPNIPPMSIKSVNKHIGGMAALLRYCADEGIVSVNNATGLKLSDKKRADEDRSTYSKDDLKRIVASLPRDPATPERYWIPLIGCYSGMRLNEICQLYVEDVQEVEGVWCFSVNDAKDKRLKNQASERMVPVHPKVIQLGFIEYLEQARSAEAPRLWMNLTWMDIHGYSNGFGKWYQRFNREYVTDDPKKVFHSFRHLVTDTLKQAGVQDSLIAEMIGHSHGSHSMTMSRYGKRYQPKLLLETIVLLDYGIDIPAWQG